MIRSMTWWRRWMPGWFTTRRPTILIAAHLDETKKADRTRPLCPFPQEAHYKGTGDSNDAANFVCAIPKDDQSLSN